MKKCSTCNENKEFSCFNKETKSKDGHKYVCKKCTSDYGKKYRKKHQTKIKEYRVEYYHNNKIKSKEATQKWREDNRGKKRIHDERWRKNNMDKIRKMQNEYYKKNDLLKLKIKVRNYIRKGLNKNGYYNKIYVEKTLGCDLPFLEKYLKNTFENIYNIKIEEAIEKLHIDHIIPLSTAKTKEDVIKLNHYTNLQYLYASHNLQKSDRLDYKIPIICDII